MYDDLLNGIAILEKQQNGIRAILDSNEVDIEETEKKLEQLKKKMNLEINAVNLIAKVTDSSVSRYYQFTTETVNSALERIFQDAPRKIKLEEGIRGNTHKQLYVTVVSENGIEREIEDTGHGIGQIISLIVSLTAIVIKKDRRLMLLDEILYGCSLSTRKIIDKILWAFTDIGFQFILSEHSYVPEGAKVYWLENQNESTRVKSSFLSKGYQFMGDDREESSNDLVDYEKLLT